MYRPGIKRTLFLSIFIISQFAAASAQSATSQPIGRDLTATLYFVVGSDEDPGGRELGPRLDALFTAVRETHGYSQYRIIDAQTGRAAPGGLLETGSILSLASAEPDGPSYIDWRMILAKSATGETSSGRIGIESFRAGMNIPVRSMSPNPNTGLMQSSISYQNAGVTSSRFGVAPDQPTLVGTVTVPAFKGTLFIVLMLNEAPIN
jgi:hypothetical protein